MTDLAALARALDAIEHVEVALDVPAAEFCTYRVGGPLAILARIGDRDALAAVAGIVAAGDAETLVVGRGSNLLVSDSGFAGLALHLVDGFADVEIAGDAVTAGAAASLPVVARATVAAGLRGFEWAVGVPGSIGGAVRMNAGGHGSDMAASLTHVEVADLDRGVLVTRSADSLELGYRRSNLAPTDVVVSATLGLAPGTVGDGTRLLSEIVAWRREHQPGGANAGSVFTNPPGDSAGRLIDVAGLKGVRVGTAEVSRKHANFIQCDPGGSADDVIELMRAVVKRVEAHHGVRLHAETRLVGFSPALVAEVQHVDPRAGQD